MTRRVFQSVVAVASLVLLVGMKLTGQPAGMPSTKNGDWTHYTADVHGTKYSPLDQITSANFNQLEVAWRFKTDNLGTRPEFKLEGTPLAIKGVLYTTAGTRRSVVALDGRTGELIWTHSYREGNRAAIAPRQLSGRGVSYWTDGKGDERILYVTTGYRLVSLNAKNGAMVTSFGEGGVVDLKKGAVTGKGQQIELETGEIGLHSTPTVVGNVVLIGSSFKEGMTVATHNNTKGLVRAFDVKSGKLLWTFNTIPRPGEFGNDTWENESWATNGNTGVWSQITVDEDAGLVYLPVEDPTSDYYGGHRPGNNLFGDSIVCVDLKTGQRKWHFQIVHHPIWDYDLSSAPLLADVVIDGRLRKIVALPTKETFLYVFDRVTGEPIWPIEERPVPQSDVPGEKTSPTQPFPTKPPAYARQAVTENDLIDFTPELRKQALEQFNWYKHGPMFTPGVVSKAEGPVATLSIGTASGGTNWPGGSFDPETNIAYLYACNSCLTPIGLVQPPADFKTDMRYVSGQAEQPFRVAEAAGAGTYADTRGEQRERPAPPRAPASGSRMTRGGTTVQGMPLVKPPYGTITAIDLTKGDIRWQVAHGDTPDAIRNNPALKGLQIPKTGQTGINVGTLVTKTLVIAGDGQVTTTPEHPRGAMLRAYDKATGREVGAVFMPAPETGSPMTYAVNGKQYIVLAISGGTYSGEYVAFTLPAEARTSSQKR
ncbi:MAG: PQQ-binding-like beta-propeller repeat protein [Vicinamibacterales bacterium]